MEKTKNKKHPRYTGLGPVLDSHNLDIFFGFLNHVILEWVIFDTSVLYRL